MDSQTPIKPPRGVKTTKETSGLLMTVIRTLSKSDSNEQRDQVRMKLEKDYKESNQVLEELVSIHHDDLNRVMNLFGRLSTLVSHARENVHNGKEKLAACKTLLTCRRDELKTLWQENLEYKYTLQYLKEIELIKDVPSQLVSCLSRKDYSTATRLIISSINTSDNTLKEVLGLQELRNELQLKKQELYSKLVEEIKEQIYVRSTYEIVALKRQGSGRDLVDHHTPTLLLRTERKTSAPSRLGRTLEVPSNLRQIKFQKDEIEFSDDPEYILSNLLECLTLLDKVPEFLEALKQNIPRELENVIVRTSKELSSSGDSANVLLEFLQIVLEQFRAILDAYKFVIETLKNKNQPLNNHFDLKNVWFDMQKVLEQMLSEYLDVENAKKTEQSSEAVNSIGVEPQHDINSFFTRKKYQRTTKGPLFKFDNSAQTNEFRIYEREARKERRLLCKPSPSYITDIYVPVTRFSEEIEQIVNCGATDQPCHLNVFVNNLVSKAFLGKRFEEITVNGGSKEMGDGLSTPHFKESNGIRTTRSSPLITALTTTVVFTPVQ